MSEVKRFEMEKEYSLDINIVPTEYPDGSFVHYDDYAALQEQLAQRDAQITRLTTERDALREEKIGKNSNTRDAADIYFQLVEECEIPPAGSLVQYVDGLKEQIAALTAENEYIRNRFKEADLMFGKNLLVMRAAIIEWQATGEAKNGLTWIYNTLWGSGELPDENEKDAQAYFDREYAPIDKELMELHRWFWEQHKRDAELREGK